MANNNDDFTGVRLKSVKTGQTKNGNDRVSIYFTGEEFSKLVSQAEAKATQRGIKLDIIMSERQSQDGRAFTSGVVMVDGIQEPNANGPGGDKGGNGRGRFVPKKSFSTKQVE